MPNTPNAKKTLRQSIDRRDRNRSTKSAVRTQLRKVRAAIAARDVDLSEAEFKLAVKRLDKAAAANIVHPNAAARTKSRLSKAIKNLKTPSSSPA